MYEDQPGTQINHPEIISREKQEINISIYIFFIFYSKFCLFWMSSQIFMSRFKNKQNTQWAFLSLMVCHYFLYHISRINQNFHAFNNLIWKRFTTYQLLSNKNQCEFRRQFKQMHFLFSTCKLKILIFHLRLIKNVFALVWFLVHVCDLMDGGLCYNWIFK